MCKMRLSSLAALAVASSLFMSSRANADFSYITTISFQPAGVDGTSAGVATTPILPTFSTTGTASFGNTILTLTGVSRGGFSVPGIDTLNFADVNVTTSAARGGAGDSFSVGYTLNIALTNTPSPGTLETKDLRLSGVITFSGVNLGAGTVTNMFMAPSMGSVVIGGITFTGAANASSPPTINGTGGSIGGTVVAAVPEPASMAMLGVGGLGALVMFRRRKAMASA